MFSPREETEMGGAQRSFQPTLWTIVLKAKDAASPDRRNALELLIRAYWKPVYFFLRRRGTPTEEAKDLTQGFFTHLLPHDFLKEVSRDKGKFRTYLLKSLTNYAANQAKHDRARKRGGDKVALSLDFAAADAQYVPEPESKEDLDRYFERQWALAVIARALDALSHELDAAAFEALKPHLAGGPKYEETAEKLGLSTIQLNNLIHKTRKRYRELVKREVSASVADPALVEEEVQDLFKALKS